MKKQFLTKNNTLLKFLSLPQIDAIFDEHEVIMVFVSGSRAVGLYNEWSDYDICFLVNDDCEYINSARNGFGFCIDDVPIHFYITPRNTIYKSYYAFSTFLIKLAAWNESNVLYYNNTFAPLISRFKDNLLNLAWVGMLKLRSETIEKLPTKIFYNFMLGTNLLFKKQYNLNQIGHFKDCYDCLTTDERNFYYREFEDITQRIDAAKQNWTEEWEKVSSRIWVE